jgi:hypothetical protein
MATRRTQNIILQFQDRLTTIINDGFRDTAKLYEEAICELEEKVRLLNR